jgi:hypothetical protein
MSSSWKGAVKKNFNPPPGPDVQRPEPLRPQKAAETLDALNAESELLDAAREPSAGAKRIANGYIEISSEWRRKLAEEIDAFAAQAIAAERRKLLASEMMVDLQNTAIKAGCARNVILQELNCYATKECQGLRCECDLSEVISVAICAALVALRKKWGVE